MSFDQFRLVLNWGAAILFCSLLLVTGLWPQATSPLPRGAGPSTRLLTPEEFKQRLSGPILVIPTPFRDDLSIDYQGVRNMIQGALGHDLKVVALTAGDSKYSVLSEDEIRAMTKTMVEAAGDRALTIGATGRWTLEEGETVEDLVRHIVSYARFAENVGVNGLQVLLPGELSEDEYVQHYGEIARRTRLPIVLHGNFSEPLLRRLLEIDSIAAMKEDIGLQYLIDRLAVFGERLAIFTGGAESRFLVAYPYGCRAYYSVFYQFAPEVGQQFWALVQEERIRDAGDFVVRYEYPLMSRFTHGLWHAALEYFGIAPRYLRPPYETLSEEEFKEMERLFATTGIAQYRKDQD